MTLSCAHSLFDALELPCYMCNHDLTLNPMQKEFWLRVIRMCRKADLTPCLQVDLPHFQMFLRPMELSLLQFLLDLLLMVLFLHLPCQLCGHLLHNLVYIHLCKYLPHNHGKVSHNNQVSPVCLHNPCSSLGACRPHHQCKWLHLYQDPLHYLRE